MSQGFGHPHQWDHHLPGMNNLLAAPPPTRAGTTSPLLPPPSKDPCAPHHVGSTSLAQYRSPKAGDRIPQGRQGDLYAQSPVAAPLNHLAHKHRQRDRNRVLYKRYTCLSGLPLTLLSTDTADSSQLIRCTATIYLEASLAP